MPITKTPPKKSRAPGGVKQVASPRSRSTRVDTPGKAAAKMPRKAASAPVVSPTRRVSSITPTSLVTTVAEVAAQSREAFERVVSALMPATEVVPDEGFVQQARRNAELRSSLLGEYTTLTGEQVGRLTGSAAHNRAALASRRRRAASIFGVPVAGSYRYPVFQFADDGRPREAMRELISVFPETAREWQLFAWMTSPNPFLEDARPLDHLDDDVKSVVRAARTEFDTSRF